MKNSCLHPLSNKRCVRSKAAWNRSCLISAICGISKYPKTIEENTKCGS